MMSNDDQINKMKLELTAHEVQCEERWKTTFNRLDDIDGKLDRMEQRQLHMGGGDYFVSSRTSCYFNNAINQFRQRNEKNMDTTAFSIFSSSLSRRRCNYNRLYNR